MACLSPFHFARMFRQRLGVPPQHHLAQLRLQAALAVGIHGYLHLDGTPHDLLTGIRLLAGGARYLGPTAAQRIADSLRHAALTPRQLQVLRLVARGAGNKRVAQLPRIAPGTVKSHVKTISAQLGVRSRTHAVRIALERRLLDAAA